LGWFGDEKWGAGLWEGWGLEEEEVKGDGGEKKEAVGGSKFYFYFAEKDHWVADECRDEFIEKRARHEKGRTSVVVDEAGIPHAFCIRKSCLSMALVCLGWLTDS
jgi:hypothetical protein